MPLVSSLRRLPPWVCALAQEKPAQALTLKEVDDEHRDGRRNQALDSQAQERAGA